MLKPGDHKVAPIGAKLRLDGPSAVSPPPCGEASRVGSRSTTVPLAGPPTPTLPHKGRESTRLNLAPLRVAPYSGHCWRATFAHPRPDPRHSLLIIRLILPASWARPCVAYCLRGSRSHGAQRWSVRGCPPRGR